MQSDAKRIQDLVDPEDGESNHLASVGPRVERTNGDLLPCKIVVHKKLDYVFKIALDVGNERRVWPDGK